MSILTLKQVRRQVETVKNEVDINIETTIHVRVNPIDTEELPN